MWIEIKDDIFESVDDGNLTYLLKILFDMPKGSQNHRADLLVNIGNIIDSPIFQGLSSTDQGLIEDSVKLFSYEENITVKYKVSNAEKECYNLEEATAFFQEPLWIVVENSMNDSNFVKAIIHHFDDSKKFLIDCLNNRWVQFANAGGSAAKHEINNKLTAFDSLAARYSSKNEKYFKGFVIMDGDRDYPQQDVKDEYIKLCEFLDFKNIKWHILEKRAMENYMPDETIADIKNIKSTSTRHDDRKCIEWINVYQLLSNDQKNHLKFQSSKRYEDLELPAQTLYLNQLPTNYSILHEGINYRDNESNGIDEDERRFKNSFPKLFLFSPHVNKMSLQNRCGNNELQNIYNSIKSLV